MKIKVKNVEQLKTMLLRKGFSQRSLAKQIGISSTYATQIINGDRNPGPKIANNIVCALGCEFDDIFFINRVCSSK